MQFLKALKIEILIKQADLPSFMTRMSSDSTKSVYGAIFNDQRQSWTHGGDLGWRGTYFCLSLFVLILCLFEFGSAPGSITTAFFDLLNFFPSVNKLGGTGACDPLVMMQLH